LSCPRKKRRNNACVVKGDGVSCLILMPPKKVLAVISSSPGPELLPEILEYFGDSVTVVHSFPAAMDLLRSSRFDLIIADVHVHDDSDSAFLHSMFDFLRWVKGDPLSRPTPFVCYSYRDTDLPKYLGEAASTSALVLGAQSYMSESKPHSNDIRQVIESLLRKGYDELNYNKSSKADGMSLEGLEVVRQKLLEDMDKVRALVGPDITNEINLLRSGLKGIEELIEQARKNGSDI